MNDVIYIVYYANGAEPVRVIKAFRSLARTKEYVGMLMKAPYPGQKPQGYTYAPIHLN
ncbi:hypothetical protein ACFQ5J_03920 [Lacticaseibacillus baoqingensis]|uniref:Uncharacterized protein n=1 Tax=Lacticaseibacillus baoqingensis TaxID=2486013 RepID=A0ABW4E4A2_9LACO|nr:hypothetical protein [Lacticaseibacillus baoqingensis]